MPDATGGDLHTLLGADPALPPERLRALYESHMNAAVRGNDHRRALLLSRAYDALPAAVRRGMYSASVPEDRWLPVTGRPPARWRRRRVARTRSPGDDPRWRTPTIVVVAVVLVGALLWWQGVFAGLLGTH